jgi:hypothetical protein
MENIMIFVVRQWSYDSSGINIVTTDLKVAINELLNTFGCFGSEGNGKALDVWENNNEKFSIAWYMNDDSNSLDIYNGLLEDLKRYTDCSIKGQIINIINNIKTEYVINKEQKENELREKERIETMEREMKLLKELQEKYKDIL